MLACGHDTSACLPAMCAHLRERREGSIEFYQWYTGERFEVELLCTACLEARERGEVLAAPQRVCEPCLEFVIRDVGEFRGTCGRTEIRERPRPFASRLVESPLPQDWGEIADFAPIDGERGSIWLLLSAGGQLIRFDADSGEAKLVAETKVSAEPDHKPWCGCVLRRRLHVSRKGDAAAVVNDFGQHGELLDLRRGRATAQLACGDYYPGTVSFSFAFFEAADGRTIAVHRTKWNRLDYSDPFTGELLSERDPPKYQPDVHLEHYLNYFHGRLIVSPDRRRVLNDGWIWHPFGVPRVFSLESWLGNVWESEDGPSCRDLCRRPYYWNGSLAWVDENRVAIGGVGEDDDEIIPGVRIFDLRDEIEFYGFLGGSAAFPGPAGEFFSDGESLFSAGPGGLSRWDLTDGCRTGHLPGFEPSRHHRGAGELAQVSAGRLQRWKIG